MNLHTFVAKLFVEPIFSKYNLELVDTVVSWNECNLKILSPPIKLLSLYSTFLELFRIKNGDQYSAF